MIFFKVHYFINVIIHTYFYSLAFGVKFDKINQLPKPVHAGLKSHYMFTNLTTIPSKVRLGLNATDKKVTIEGCTLLPFYSLRVRAINREGFSWGDNSAGTLQLALALLLHFTDIETTILLYKEFARQFVSTWKFKGTAIIKLNMRAIIAGLLEEHKILEVI